MGATGDSKSQPGQSPTVDGFLDDQDRLIVDEDGFPSIGGGEEGFASSFYRSGTDWSHLVSEEMEGKGNVVPGKGVDSDRDSEKKLKQASLFRLWGLKRKEADDRDGYGSSSFLAPKRTKRFDQAA